MMMMMMMMRGDEDENTLFMSVLVLFASLCVVTSSIF